MITGQPQASHQHLLWRRSTLYLQNGYVYLESTIFTHPSSMSIGVARGARSSAATSCSTSGWDCG